MKIEKYEFPENLLYDKRHFWIRDDGDVLTMGITDFAQQIAGQFIVAEIPDEGQKVKKNKPFMSIESGKWVGRVYSPVNGVISEVNEDVDDDATLMNSSPYGDGWLVKIKPDNTDEIQDLFKVSDEEYVNWVKEEIAEHAQEE